MEVGGTGGFWCSDNAGATWATLGSHFPYGAWQLITVSADGTKTVTSAQPTDAFVKPRTCGRVGKMGMMSALDRLSCQQTA